MNKLKEGKQKYNSKEREKRKISQIREKGHILGEKRKSARSEKKTTNYAGREKN